jgi:hypothetical protein
MIEGMLRIFFLAGKLAKCNRFYWAIGIIPTFSQAFTLKERKGVCANFVQAKFSRANFIGIPFGFKCSKEGAINFFHSRCSFLWRDPVSFAKFQLFRIFSI